MFGCRAFVHVPKDERSKLDSKSKECIFLGYGNEEFWYILWDPVEKKIIRSRNVVFFEDQNIEDIQKGIKPVISREHPINLDPMPPLEHYEGDQIEDIGDVENEPPINNGSTEEVANGNISDGDNEDIIEDYEDEEQEPQLRKSSRIPKPQTKYPATEFVLLTDGGKPKSYEEFFMDNHKEEWLKSMQEEMQPLHENSTYKLVDLPKGKRALKNKWVYKLKIGENNS